MKYMHYLLTIVVIAFAGYYIVSVYQDELSGSRPAFGPIEKNIEQEIGSEEDVFDLPEGFTIELLTSDVPGARDLALDSSGNLWVSQTKEGKVSMIDVSTGLANVILEGLNRPHGLAFHPEDPGLLYIAEFDQVSKLDLSDPERKLQHVADIPIVKGRHFTRSLLFDQNGRLFLSIGSSCDTCREPNEHYAAINRVNEQTGNLEVFANGLRNAVFMTLSPDNRIWVTEMGRDFLGDDLPPDEINIIEEGKFYGWPICYGKNIHDTAYDKNTYIRNPCEEPFETPSYIDIPAHSAPLGLDFVPSTSKLPKDWHGDLIVAYHGSWNRSVPTGYKLVRIKLQDGDFVEIEDFVTGWLINEHTSIGRPVDVEFTPTGVLYVSDDKAGAIYRIIYEE